MRFQLFSFQWSNCLTGLVVLAMGAGQGMVLAEARKSAAESPVQLTSFINQRIEAGWKQNDLEPAALIDDAGFLRRVSLDLIGRIPTIAETRNFLESSKGSDRRQLVDRLLTSPEFDRHFATVLRRIWIPQTDTQQFARLIGDYERWLARRLRERTPFDELVRQQLNVPVSQLAVPINPDGHELGSSAFLAVSEMKPEYLAANSARAFLGVNIDCAQCHDHPFARWTRKQFWQTAAFFARPNPQQPSDPFSISIGETQETVTPKLLTEEPFNWPANPHVGTGRQLLAEWMTSPDNPYFARNAVNRIWAEFFGRGFVEPLDDLSGAVPSTHPELFEELAREFAGHHFDLRFLIRGIVLSRAYQLSTVRVRSTSPSDDPFLFSRMPVRLLTGEQLFESLRTVAGLPYERHPDHNTYFRSSREQFAAQFLVPRPIEGQRSLVQALTMMNGDVTSQVTHPKKSPLLSAVAKAPFLSPRERVETLFLAAYSRYPTESEVKPLLEHLRSQNNCEAALADIFWALLNSSEFHTNH